ncbi:hypothetical protein [Deinococcus soli (ex Cha et al. 2016)]|uniref:hypothetical protein n=1 Tax=Deinococcus soli (ex Cha et al. 2016) TaxID=1309411 RepID=UPI00166E46FA|nr:hypothetical protein [Deinococcus soli (ex Cha et al. 2016)]
MRTVLTTAALRLGTAALLLAPPAWGRLWPIDLLTRAGTPRVAAGGPARRRPAPG